MTYVNNREGRVYCGLYADEQEAAWMRDQYAIELHGDFACLNFEYLNAGYAQQPEAESLAS